MARLTRKNIKVFAGNATNNGVFGSLQAENPVTTTNVEQIQSLPAWSVGWNSATMTSEKLPPLEEFQGIQYVTTYQQAYLMQEGMPEWASTVTYYKGSLTKEVTSNGFRIYCSLTNDNTNNLLSDTSNWKLVMDSNNLYAFDNAVVHKTGTETITGAKTFTSDVTISNDYPMITLKESDTVKGTNPSTEQSWGLLAKDSSNGAEVADLGSFVTHLKTDGTVWSGMGAYKNVANSTDKASIRVYYPQSGSAYTYAPTPTETTTTSGTQIATTGWVNSAGNNVVHRTGSETIAGTKTFTSNSVIKNGSPRLYIDNSDMTKGTAPTLAKSGFVYFRDSADNLMGNASYTYGTNKDATMKFRVYKANTSSDTEYVDMELRYPHTGNPYATAPASDVNGSILTTIDHFDGVSQSYYKLGNGLIIQWGKFTASGVSAQDTVTFPTAFTSSNASVTITRDDNMWNEGVPMQVQSITTTDFKCRVNAGVVHWIAIGY